jgi:hypothetical protein
VGPDSVASPTRRAAARPAPFQMANATVRAHIARPPHQLVEPPTAVRGATKGTARRLTGPTKTSRTLRRRLARMQ